MKTTFQILFFFYSFNLVAQNLMFSSGYVRNSYYSFSDEEGYQHSKYEPGSGYSAFAGYDSIVVDSIAFDIVISFNNYMGHVNASNGTHISSSWTDIETNMARVGLSIIPLRFAIGKNLKIKSGIDLNYLIKNKIKGTKGYYFMATGDIDTLNGPKDNIVNHFSFGLILKAEYEIRLSEKLFLVPQYMINLGLTNEFRNIETNTKSIRQIFGIGLMKKIAN